MAAPDAPYRLPSLARRRLPAGFQLVTEGPFPARIPARRSPPPGALRLVPPPAPDLAATELPVTVVVPPPVSVGDVITAAHENVVSKGLNDLWINVQYLAAQEEEPAVASVFGRTGAVVAQAGDYAAAQITNAVDASQTYDDPAWLAGVSWDKISGEPAAFPPALHVHDAIDIASGVFIAARLGTGLADEAKYLRGDGIWATMPTTMPPAAHFHDAADVTSGMMATARLGAGTADATVYLRGDGAWSALPVVTPPVSSVFGRAGAVVAVAGDYTASQVTNAVDASQSYDDPAWLASIDWSKVTGEPTVFPPQSHTHDASETVSGVFVAARLGTGAADADVFLRGDGTWAALPAVSSDVSSVFGRMGAVVAQAGDYTAAQVTGAVSALETYEDPAWITSLGWGKITGAPAVFPPAAHTHDASDTISGVFTVARLGAGAADATTFLRGDGIWAVPPAGGAGGSQTPWTQHVDAAGFELRNAGRIGIGTAAPAERLSLSSGNVLIDAFTDAGNSQYLAQHGIFFRAGFTPGAAANESQRRNCSITTGRGTADLGDCIDINGAHHISFYTSATERMRITDTGNVGIGTAAPETTLHVRDSALALPVAGAVKGNVYIASDGPWGLQFGHWVDGTTWMQSQRSDGNASLYTLALNPLGGNVGIGTSGPSAALHAMRHTGGPNANWFEPGNYAGVVHHDINSTQCYGLLVSHRYLAAESIAFAVDGRFTTGGGSVGEDGHYPRFIVRGDGNVGIGTATPTQKLDVEGNIRVATYLYVGAHVNTTANVTTNAPSHIAMMEGSDNWIRWQTLAQFRAHLGSGSQTPWTQTIDAAQNSLINVRHIVPAGNVAANYTNAAIEVRESAFAGAADGSANYAPRISFHWSGRVASQIGMDASGVIRTFDSSGTAYADFAAYGLYANHGLTSHLANYPVMTDSKWQLYMGEPSRNAAYHLKIGYINNANWKGMIQAIAGNAGEQLCLNPQGGAVTVGSGADNPASRFIVCAPELGNSVAWNGVGAFAITTGTGVAADRSILMGMHNTQGGWIQAIKGPPGTTPLPLTLNPQGGNVIMPYPVAVPTLANGQWALWFDQSVYQIKITVNWQGGYRTAALQT